MTDLADRLLALPEREASDLFLTEVCGWRNDVEGEKNYKYPMRAWRNADGVRVKDCDRPNPWGNLQDAWECAPEGMLASVAQRRSDVRAMLCKEWHNTSHPTFEGIAPTPSAALCLAVASIKESENG